MRDTTLLHVLCPVRTLWKHCSCPLSGVFSSHLQFVVLFVLYTLLWCSCDETTGSRTQNISKFLPCSTFFALLKSIWTGLTHTIRNLFDCRNCTIWGINFWVGNSLDHCSVLASWASISSSPFSALEMESLYELCYGQKWNGLPGTKIVLSSCGPPDSFS